MLKLYDKEHNAIGHINKYTDCVTESEVATGDKSLSFTYQAKYHNIENEMYVRTRTDEYVVKEISESSDGFPQIVCMLNVEELEAKAWGTFSVTDVTIDEAARFALAGTGWRVGECTVTKRRNAGMVQVNSLGVIQNLCIAFMCEPVFDTINKTVSFYEQRGEDRGVYFMQGLNLRKLQKKSTSYDFYTRIIPIGADDLTIETVNDGKNYLENFQYSSKVRTYIWKVDSYTDAQALKEDAEKKLADMSKPERSYAADIRDLAKQKPEYSVLSYGLGDMVTLIDANTGTREKQRIMRLVEYEADPNKNTAEIANTVLTFEELQEKLQAAADIVNYAMTGDGKIYVSDILNFEKGLSDSVTVGGIQNNVSSLQGNVSSMQGNITSMQGDINKVKLQLGELDTNFLTTEEADIKYATIENLNATNQTVHSIEGDYAKFKTTTTDELAANRALIDEVSGNFASFKTGEFESLRSKQADFETATAQNFSAANANITKVSGDLADYKEVVAGKFTASEAQIQRVSGELADYKTVVSQEMITAKGWMLEGAIGDAQISSVAANKLTAGTIDTAIVTIAGSDGRLQIVDNTIQIKDANRVRVQVGKDAFGDYTLAVWDASGKLIWDALGATENTIQRKIIRDKMVADDAAIQALKIDFQSFDTALTQQGVTISGTVVQVGSKTLNVALSEQTQAMSDNYTELKAYTDTAKQSAISTAAGDAATKANNALASAKSYADAAVDGLEIGGRNLIAASKEIRTTRTTTNNWIQETGWKINNTPYGFQQIQKGGQFTLSFDYEITNITTATNATLSLRSGQNVYSQTMQTRIPLSVGDNVGHYEATFEPNENAKQYGTGWLLSGFGAGKNAGAVIILRNIKLEKGSKATDWSPAPEDIQSEIDLTNATVATHTETLSNHDTRITANENAIKLKVSTQDFNSYKTTVTGQISTAKTEAINTAASDAKTKADKALSDAKAYTSAQITTVNQSLSTTNQEISVMKGQIALKVEQTDIDSAVQSIQIGGNNILYNSTGIKGTAGWRSYATSFVSNRANTWPGMTKYGFKIGNSVTSEKSAYSTRFYLKQSTTYTISGYALVDSTAKSLDVWVLTSTEIDSETDTSSGYTHTFGYALATKNKWIFFTNTFTTPTGTKSGYVRLDNNGAAASGTEGFCYFCDLMLVEGNKAVSWAPSVKDTEAEFAKYSTTTQMNSAINLAKNSITQSVSETYATKSALNTANSNITSLTTRVSSAESKLTKDSLVTTIGSYYTTATYVGNAIKDIDIGGRNLVKNSATLNGLFAQLAGYTGTRTEVADSDALCGKHIEFKCVTAGSGWHCQVFPKTADRIGKTFTWSFWAKCSVAKSGSVGSETGGQKSISLTTAWKKFTHTWVMQDSQYQSFAFYLGWKVGEIFYIRDFKIEEGNKATSWTPAPEDTDSAIASVKTVATQTATKIGWLVKSGSSASDFTLTDRTATLIADAINLKGLVTFSGLDSAAQSKITTAQSTANTANTKATNAQTAVDKIQTGLGIKWNYSAFATANDGEAYLCAYNQQTGALSDAAGWVMWNGVKRTIAKGMINPNSMCPFNKTVYIVCRLSSAGATSGTNYLVWYNSGWKSGNIDAATSATVSAWTWVEATDIVLGSFVEPAAEGAFVDCVLYNLCLKSSQVTAGDTAYIKAATAQSTANTAKTNAATAQSTANAAKTTANAADSAIAAWSYNNDRTYINGGKIYTGTITAEKIAANAITSAKIATDAIKSRNYAYSSGNFSTAGTYLDLSNGAIRSKNFAIDSAGNAYFNGTLNGATGSFSGKISGSTIAGSTIESKGILSNGETGKAVLAEGKITFKRGTSENVCGSIGVGDGENAAQRSMALYDSNGNVAIAIFSNGIDVCMTTDFTGAVRINELESSRVLISGAYGKIEASSVLSTQLSYLSGATSNIQTQLNALNTKIGKIQIVGISSISAQSSGMIAVGSGEQISSNFAAMAGATDYLVVPYATGYGTITDIIVNGTKVLIKVLNPGSGAHTITVRAYVIGYKLV